MDVDLGAKINTLAEVLHDQVNEIAVLRRQIAEMFGQQIAIQTAFAGFAIELQKRGVASADDLAVSIRQTRSSEAAPSDVTGALDRYLDGLEKTMIALSSRKPTTQ